MQVSGLIKQYLGQAYVMQLATSNGEQPWVCTLYFVADTDFKIYWLSWPSRRHSVELEKNDKAAITMAIKTDRPDIGLGAEGSVEIIDEISIIEKIMPKYITKYGSGKDFLRHFKDGRNEHCLYALKPRKFVLVDEVNFPGQGSIDWAPND